MEEDGIRHQTQVQVVSQRATHPRHGCVWQLWKIPKTDQWEPTFAIATSDPNGKMSEIHDRQPVILDPREYAEWLAESERPPLHLLRILPDEDLLIDSVSPPPLGDPEPP